MSDKNITAEHIEQRTIHDFAIDPDHIEREESAEFREAKHRLKQDGHYKCYICGTTENIQVHHRASEFMFNNVVDFDLLKEFCEEWDVYGYGKLLKHKQLTTCDDVRNQLCLCMPHHIGVNHEDGGGGTGIHSLTFPSWIIQKLALPNANPIPQKGETFAQAMERVKKFDRFPDEQNA
jgi:hypothetical protein